MQKPWGGTQPGGFAGPLGGGCDWSRGRRGKEFGSPQGYWEAIAEFRAGEGYDGSLCPPSGPGREGCLEAGKGLSAEILPKETWRKISSPVPRFLGFSHWLRNWRRGLGERIPVLGVQGPGAHSPPHSGDKPH